MHDRIRAARLPLWIALVFFVTGCGQSKKTTDPTDVETLRVELRKRVANGDLTKLEAQVRLAEAIARAKKRERKAAADGKLSPALAALAEELKAKVQAGDVTEQEAKARFDEAMKRAETSRKAKPAAGQKKDER